MDDATRFFMRKKQPVFFARARGFPVTGKQNERADVIGLVDRIGEKAAFNGAGFIDCAELLIIQMRTVVFREHGQFVEIAFALGYKLIAEVLVNPLIFSGREFEFP